MRPSRASRGPTRSSSSAPTLTTLEETSGSRSPTSCGRVRGIENVGIFHIVGQPNLEIQIDREACARYGINVADVEEVVQVAIGGRAFSRDGRGREALRHRPAAAQGPARRPRATSPASRSTSQGPKASPARASRSRTWRRSSPTSQVPRTSTARTTDASSRSSSASATATWPPRSPRRRRKVEGPRDRRQAPAGLPDRVVRRVRPDGGRQQAADVDGAALDRADPGSALHACSAR